MKKTFLMTCTLLALAAGIAAAGPGALNLAWDDCGGLASKTFACASNAGTDVMVGTFVAPCCVDSASANEIVVDLQSTGAVLPAWWQMRAGQCRSVALSQSASGFATTCFDYWAGLASGGISQDVFVNNRARIKVLEGLPAGSDAITGIPEGTEVYSFKINIGHGKTVGTGACAGCQTGVCIVLNSIKINQTVHTPAGDKFISTPGARNWVTYQGGIGGDCYQATPAKNTTWGTVKALYR